jgi:hypothetical protein
MESNFEVEIIDDRVNNNGLSIAFFSKYCCNSCKCSLAVAGAVDGNINKNPVGWNVNKRFTISKLKS